MKKTLLLLLSRVLLSYNLAAQSPPSLLTPYEQSEGKETATYARLSGTTSNSTAGTTRQN